MRKRLDFLLSPAPGVLLCCGLAVAGQALAARAGLPVPGAVLGLGVYLAWLLAGGAGWSGPGAALLLRWLGAMIVPALVGLEAEAMLLVGAAAPLALLMVATTLVTAAATVGLYRLAGGRG